MCGARSGTPSRFLTFSVVACSSRFDRPSQLSRLAKRMHGRTGSCSLERKRLQASALSGGKQQAVASKRSRDGKQSLHAACPSMLHVACAGCIFSPACTGCMHRPCPSPATRHTPLLRCRLTEGGCECVCVCVRVRVCVWCRRQTKALELSASTV
jgi:hypothetical protein